MNIEGLAMLQISRLMETYLAEHFTGYVVVSDANGMFAEVVRLAYEEIEPLIPTAEQKQLYNQSEWFNGASGVIELSDINDGSSEKYTLMLLMNDQQTRALYLYLSKWCIACGDAVLILVKDFVKG